jgi:beta-phosphoglucomutase-like phosphatase (HAD superfamily)
VISGIALDFEGTLVNVEQPHFDGFLAVARKLGIEHLGFTRDAMSFEGLIPGSVGGGDPFNIEEMLKLADEEPADARVEELRLLKMEVYDRALEELVVRPRSGAQEFVVDFVTNELWLPIAIGSLTPHEQTRTLFGQSKVDQWFPAGTIVLREDVQRVKPEPDVYLETARRMGIKPSEQLVFEDSGSGLRAAIAAGSSAIAVPVYKTPSYTEKLMRLGAVMVFGSWEDPELYELVGKLTS